MRIIYSAHKLALLSSVFLVGACAYTTKASHQDITFLSLDAQDAKCLVYVNKVKYQVWPPQTINIKKSSKTMKVECHAPGNRNLMIEVAPSMEKVALWGTPIGVAWDYASQSLFSYPSVIAIDFSQQTLRPFMPPKHNNKDIRQPESYDLEEFLPKEQRLNSDKDKKSSRLLRRGEGNDGWEDKERENNVDTDFSFDEQTDIMEEEAPLDVEGVGISELLNSLKEMGVLEEGDTIETNTSKKPVNNTIQETPTEQLQESQAMEDSLELNNTF